MNCKNLVYLRSIAITLTILLMPDLVSARYTFDPKYEKYTLQYNMPLVKLPNLQIDKCRITPFGRDVTVTLDVENVGTADAGVHDVTATVIIGGMWEESFEETMDFGLPQGAEVTKTMGYIHLPDRRRDWDFRVTAVVDPPTETSSGGEIWESNESDNVKVCVCRVYGDYPDYSVPGC